MQQWNDIIQTAMLGTDKASLPIITSNDALGIALQKINAANKEIQLLQMACMVANYQQGGAVAIPLQHITLQTAPVETQPYCSATAATLLQEILQLDITSFLEKWLERCHHQQSLMPPACIVPVFTKAKQHKKIQPWAVACAGQRGAWLANYQQEWAFAQVNNIDELWQTGTLAERKQVLANIRATAPEQAIVLLQAVWSQENASNKQAFLEVLETNKGAYDVVWLQTALVDKSQKVKEAIWQLLKRNKASQIMQQYQQLVQASWHIKKEKALLGLMSKQVLQWQIPNQIEADIFSSGIEKLSSTKNFTDEAWILYQVMQWVDPTVLEVHLQISAAEIIQLLEKDEAHKKFLPAIVMAICNHKNTVWAIAMMQHATSFYLDILPYIPLQQQEYYSKKFFQGHEDSIIAYAMQRTTIWSLSFTEMVLKYTANHVYQYNRAFYQQAVMLLPNETSSLLASITVDKAYDQNSWDNMVTYINQLLHLKQQLEQSF